MKLYVKFLLFILVLGVAGLFFIKKPDGQPWLSLDDFMPDVPSLMAQASNMLDGAERKLDKATSSDPNAGKTKVYKWRDSSGNWHLSDKPISAAGGRDKVMHVDPDTNLVGGVRESAPEVEQSRSDGVINAVPLPMTVSPDKVGKLIDDAKAVQDLMDDRSQQLDHL